LEERVDNGGVNRLVLVENIDLESVGILGKALEIDPQFFADHVENSFWYGVTIYPTICYRYPQLMPSRDG
jgi:hypothetical protein